MSQNPVKPTHHLPPRMHPSASGIMLRGRLGAGLAIIGFVLCIVSLAMPRADAGNDYSGAIDEGFPVTTVLVVGAASVGGLVAVGVALAGRPLVMTAAVLATAVTCVMAILSYGDVTKLTRDSAGLIQRGAGLNLLILGTILSGLAGVVAMGATTDDLRPVGR